MTVLCAIVTLKLFLMWTKYFSEGTQNIFGYYPKVKADKHILSFSLHKSDCYWKGSTCLKNYLKLAACDGGF